MVCGAEKPSVVIRVPKVVISDGKTIAFDDESAVKGKIVKKGSKIAILGLGDALPLAKQAAETLDETVGVNVTVVNPMCFTTLDKDLLDELKKDHDLIATVEDGILDGGFGQKIAAYYGADPVKVLNFGGAKRFNDLVPAADIAVGNHLTAELIAEDIKNHMK